MSDGYAVSNECKFGREFLEQIHEFVRRLPIVQEAIYQLHIGVIWEVENEDKEITVESLNTLKQAMKSAPPSSGIWKTYWRYSIHGRGCRLIHLETGEPLDWDHGHKRSFDFYFFMTWLKWRFNFDIHNSSIMYLKNHLVDLEYDTIRKKIIPVTEYLCFEGKLINLNNQNRYILPGLKSEE